MADAPDPRTEFVPVTDPRESERLMADAFRATASTILWTKDQKVVLNTHLLAPVTGSTDFRAAVPPDFDAARFHSSLEQPEDCFFSVSLPSANLFFRARYVETDPTGLRFEAPQALFKVQRRNDVRLHFPAEKTLAAAFDHPSEPAQRLQVKLLDLSAGGLSFAVKAQDEALYAQKGLILKNIVLKIGSRELRLQGEVMHLRPLKSSATEGKLFKVGVKFREIRAADSQAIAAYVFQETRKFFSTL